MSLLDEELTRALAEPDAPAAAASTRVVRSPARRSLGLLLSLLVMGSLLLLLMLTSFRSAVVYSKGVEELLAERERLVGRTVRVEGALVRGTLLRRDDPCSYRFVMERGGQRLDVEYPWCSIPDTFRDVDYTEVTVTAEGRLAADGHFAATQILAKCPSKYESQAAAAAPAPTPPTRPVVE